MGPQNPYPATVVANTVLSGPTSAKEVRHCVISSATAGSPMSPATGSRSNPSTAVLVDRVLARLGATGEEMITDRKTQRTLRDALTHHYEIAMPSYLVDYVAARTGDAELTHLAATGDHESLDAWLWGATCSTSSTSTRR